MNADKTAADRQARSRAARRAAGCARVSVTLSPEAAKALERLHAHHGGTVAETIAHALIELDLLKTCTVRPYPRRPEPFGAAFVAAFVAGVVPDPGKGAIETTYTASEGSGVGTVTPAVRWHEEMAEDRSSTTVTVTSPIGPFPPRA